MEAARNLYKEEQREKQLPIRAGEWTIREEGME